MSDQPHLLTESDGHVAIVRINRPKVLNALNLDLMRDLAGLLEGFDADDSVRVILLAGGERAWAAGADIGDMATATRADMEQRDQFTQWERIKRIRKPIVAAVSGFALGGGCELMMHCDVIVCSETAKIGQPEINIGVMPGAGGTQRLTRAVGKAIAMDVVLSGRFLSAREAMSHGLVSRVVPREHWYDHALKIAHAIAAKAPISLQNAKESVLNAEEQNLSDGLVRERQLFYELFDTEDQKEGMAAFMEKRRPTFTGK
ncbi:MAG: enoyl-CoA hydratase-related protein [Phycisphaerales bacterium]|jgi:enoyl-CoA hydratase|nr:enoyl-CoA hydratase-related protein [Phycisphaerales bacterium]